MEPTKPFPSWAWPLLVAVLLSAALAFFSCAPGPAAPGEACSVYETGQACQKNVSCQCYGQGCFCVFPCDPLDAGCLAGQECVAGFRPGQSQTGFYCFAVDAGSTGF